MPRMLRDILAEILLPQPDMEVLEAAPLLEELPDAALERGANVVIVEADDPAVAEELLLSLPRMRVLTVTGEGRDSWLYELRPHRARLGEVSPRTLVEHIRRTDPHATRWTE